ncbi:xaa-Pro dipeptidase [Microthyrium microscopicum]|uniref:Probable Xaa-Pro aminopeptidase P n=1 Tax=Microthyrium microscopicum TaxID=703497 RepID=A0A6A6U3D2_9PEZI|nr:xaa-Pro dipeptidase [Microthyrium microscopicum]
MTLTVMLAYISGFTGSAGTAVVTTDKAALATDGRYFNQAAKQLDTNWELLKQGMQDVPWWQDWAADQSEGGKSVSVDPTVITASEARKLSEKIKKKGGAALNPVSENLIDLVWGSEKPGRPNEKIKVHDIKYAGKKFEEKLQDLRKELEKKKSRGMVVSMLDEIAWLFNLRGNDIDYNPVFFSYALVTPTEATLYIDDTKLTDEVKSHLGDAVKIKPYNAIFEELAALKTSLQSVTSTGPETKYLIATKASWALSEGLGGEKNVEEARSPIGDHKALKNPTELEGMRACHIRDGAALTEFFAWLEDQLINQGKSIDECTAADKLEAIRSKHDKFVGLSFDTISSTGANAAVIHYKPEPGSCATIDPSAIYLCDAGAQFQDGTTDTTRTLHFGEPTDAERNAYTLVLKGHINLDRAVFPKGVSGFALDSLARQFLWAAGLDYRHGTGHGVGSFLNVHEGPIGIGTRRQYTEVPLAPGNVISNEPGYYEDGSFGIRIENVFMVREVETAHRFGDKPFLGFEHVTMVPMCRKLIDMKLLTQEERDWLNAYHSEVWEKTKSFFEKGSVSYKWLERETREY